MKYRSEVSPGEVVAQLYEMLRMVERGECAIDAMHIEQSAIDYCTHVTLRLRPSNSRDIERMMQRELAMQRYDLRPVSMGPLSATVPAGTHTIEDGPPRDNAPQESKKPSPEKPSIKPQKRELIFD